MDPEAARQTVFTQRLVHTHSGHDCLQSRNEELAASLCKLGLPVKKRQLHLLDVTSAAAARSPAMIPLQAAQQPSPEGMELGSAGGVDLAAAAAARSGPAGGNCRSPVWFRSSAVADALQDAGKC